MPIKVLIAKPGLDGHSRGAKVVAQALRDAGMEVVYTGLHQSPEMIVKTAIQEDVDVIGISILSGAHMTIIPKIISRMKENGIESKLLFVGGIIPSQDVDKLKEMGVVAIFGPGTPTGQIIDFIKKLVKKENLKEA